MTVYERKPREAKLPVTPIEKLPKRIVKKKNVKIVEGKNTPVKNITRPDLIRKNHEAFHFEFDDYKINLRYEYIEDVGKVHRILGHRKDSPKYAQDKVGMVYKSCTCDLKVPSVKNSKGYRFEPMSAEYARAYGIYQKPEFIPVSQAIKEINQYRKGVNPYRRMTTKYI